MTVWVRWFFVSIAFVGAGGLIFAVRAADAAPAAERVFRAAAVAVDITPQKLPISMNGGLRDNPATQVHDPLHARCLLLDDGTMQVAIVVCDSCAIPREVFDAAKQQASKGTGIPVERMLMSATHAHSCPTSVAVFQSTPDAEYRTFLIERIAESVRQAHQQLEPARVGWAVGRDASQVFNRRWFMKADVVNEDPFGGKADRVRMNPGRGNPNNDKPSGPVDPEVCILSVQARDGRPIGLLANYSLHYVGGVPGGTVSADYFGEFANRIAQRLKATGGERAFVGIMSNGTSGNINNVDYSRSSTERREPFEQIRVVAASVADAAMTAYETIEHRDWVSLAMAEREVELGVRLPSKAEVEQARAWLAEAGPGPYSDRQPLYARETVLMSEYPATVTARLQAIRIGELGIVSSPCETFVETGLAIKAQSPLKPTFTIELANGYNGYLPTPEHHELGGYETWRARSSYLAVEAEPKIRGALLELLNEVSAGDARRN